MHVLFANTGVQPSAFRCSGSRYHGSQIGYGWQRSPLRQRRRKNQPPEAYPYIQWQIIQAGATRLFLAVDTSCGDPEVGYFCEASSLTKDFVIGWKGCWTWRAGRLAGMPPVEVCIRPATATAGDAKHVHMVIDFGNSRTGALLVEIGRRDQPDAADAALRAAQPLSSRRLERDGRVRQRARRPAGSPRRPTGATRPTCRRCRRRRSSTTPSATRTAAAAGSAAARSPGRPRSKWWSRRRCSTTSPWSAWAARPTTWPR